VIECPSRQARSFFIKHGGVITQYPVALLSDVINLFVHSNHPAYLQLDYKNVIPFASDEPLYRLIKLIEPLAAG